MVVFHDSKFVLQIRISLMFADIYLLIRTFAKLLLILFRLHIQLAKN
jgi:hypothetical protein